MDYFHSAIFLTRSFSKKNLHIFSKFLLDKKGLNSDLFLLKSRMYLRSYEIINICPRMKEATECFQESYCISANTVLFLSRTEDHRISPNKLWVTSHHLFYLNSWKNEMKRWHYIIVKRKSYKNIWIAERVRNTRQNLEKQ